MRDLFGIHVFKSMILNTFVYLFKKKKIINKKVKKKKWIDQKNVNFETVFIQARVNDSYNFARLF